MNKLRFGVVGEESKEPVLNQIKRLDNLGRKGKKKIKKVFRGSLLETTMNKQKHLTGTSECTAVESGSEVRKTRRPVWTSGLS